MRFRWPDLVGTVVSVKSGPFSARSVVWRKKRSLRIGHFLLHKKRQLRIPLSPVFLGLVAQELGVTFYLSPGCSTFQFQLVRIRQSLPIARLLHVTNDCVPLARFLPRRWRSRTIPRRSLLNSFSRI